jgi:hypothetical protein
VAAGWPTTVRISPDAPGTGRRGGFRHRTELALHYAATPRSGEIHVSGLLRLIEPLLRRRMRGGVRSEVKAVKSDLEATDPDRRT